MHIALVLREQPRHPVGLRLMQRLRATRNRPPGGPNGA
jgi:hypothetical protein